MASARSFKPSVLVEVYNQYWRRIANKMSWLLFITWVLRGAEICTKTHQKKIQHVRNNTLVQFNCYLVKVAAAAVVKCNVGESRNCRGNDMSTHTHTNNTTSLIRNNPKYTLPTTGLGTSALLHSSRHGLLPTHETNCMWHYGGTVKKIVRL